MLVSEALPQKTNHKIKNKKYQREKQGDLAYYEHTHTPMHARFTVNSTACIISAVQTRHSMCNIQQQSLLHEILHPIMQCTWLSLDAQQTAHEKGS